MNWPIVELGEVADVNWGDTSVTKKSYEEDGFTAYSATGPDGYLSYFDYDRDAVVLSAIGARCGKTWFASGKWSCIKNTIRFWSEREDLDNRYLYWLTADPDFWPRRGAAQPFITIGDARKLSIPIPPLNEQKRIAKILDQADALRRLRQRAIDRLNILGQAIFHEMFGSKLDGLKTVGLKELIQGFRYGTSNKSSSSGYPALRIPNIIGGKIDLTELKTVEVTEAELERLKLIDGDMLFVRTNGNPDYVGRSAVFSRDAVASNSPFIYASYLIRARLSDQVNPIFLQSYLSSGIGRRALRERCKTSAGQYNINTEGLGSIPVPKIKKEHQDKFAVRKANIEEKMKVLEHSLQQSEALFHSIQQRAFRGEL